jgi:nucleoside triphosphate pyrophosphatase
VAPSPKSEIRNPKSLILASASPRRAEILSSLGISFTVDPPTLEEKVRQDETVREAVSRLAAEKAAEVAARHAGEWVLAADTLVFFPAGPILGKPRDDADAARMLSRIAGKEHRVATAVRLRKGADPGQEILQESRVRMAPLSEEEIRWYVATGEPRDKAGAYAVQGKGARFIEAIAGSYSNVMGLPARAVYRLLKDARDPALDLLALSSP